MSHHSIHFDAYARALICVAEAKVEASLAEWRKRFEQAGKQFCIKCGQTDAEIVDTSSSAIERPLRAKDDVAFGTPFAARSCAPPYFYRRPWEIGISVADSSLRRLVDGPEPHPVAIQRNGERLRAIQVYAVPGITMLPQLTEHNVSSLVTFWSHCSQMRNKVRFYVVPPNDSVGGNWGNAQKSQRLRSTRFKVADKIVELRTVRQVLADLEIAEEDAFEDCFHMWRWATRKVHEEYWLEIHDHQTNNDIRDEVAVQVWDGYNASKDKLKTFWQEHEAFWHKLTSWGLEAGTQLEKKSASMAELTALIARPGRPTANWYDKSRLKGVKEVDRHKDSSNGEAPRVWNPEHGAGGGCFVND